MESMQINTTREKLAQGGTALGCGLQAYRSTEIPRTFAAAGFDYVFIDLEHSGFDLETAQDMIRSSNDAGITPIVRVGELLYSLVSRLLDSGAQGIILPRVEDPAILREALSWMRFPPVGKRGYGVNPTMLRYEARSFPEIIEHQNKNTLAVVQFETITAIERADELLSLPGCDVAMVGPADLSIALGIPGQMDNPLLVSTVDALIQKCNQHGVVPGIQTRSLAMSKFWAERGMRFIGTAAEHALLLEKSKETVAALRSVAIAQKA
jgi:2-keto-3-deoxy-L-rhamnonate aldolase RhmA